MIGVWKRLLDKTITKQSDGTWWGVFGRHVMPCTKDGDSIAPHIAQPICLCKPELHEDIWVHNHE